MIEQELAFEKRIVVDSPGFVAFCPFAARFPFETWIVPTAHASHYESCRAENRRNWHGCCGRCWQKSRPRWTGRRTTTSFTRPRLTLRH